MRTGLILMVLALAAIVFLSYNAIVTPAQRVTKLHASLKFWSWDELWNGYRGWIDSNGEVRKIHEDRLIVVGDVVSVVGVKEQRPVCYTLYKVIVRRFVKANYVAGVNVGSVITVRSEGGKLKDGTLMLVEDRPLLKVGQRYVFFLARINNHYTVRDAFLVIKNRVYAAFTPIIVDGKSYWAVDEYGNFVGLPKDVYSRAVLNVVYDDSNPLYAYNIYGEELDVFLDNLPLRAAHSHVVG